MNLLLAEVSTICNLFWHYLGWLDCYLWSWVVCSRKFLLEWISLCFSLYSSRHSQRRSVPKLDCALLMGLVVLSKAQLYFYPLKFGHWVNILQYFLCTIALWLTFYPSFNFSTFSLAIESVVDENERKSSGGFHVATCSACEMAVVWMHNQLRQNKTEDQILTYINNVS
jgi:hypothetical protein